MYCAANRAVATLPALLSMCQTVLSALNSWLPSVLTAVLWGEWYSPHFTDDRTGVKSLGQSHIVHSGSQGWNLKTCLPNQSTQGIALNRSSLISACAFSWVFELAAIQSQPWPSGLGRAVWTGQGYDRWSHPWQAHSQGCWLSLLASPGRKSFKAGRAARPQTF